MTETIQVPRTLTSAQKALIKTDELVTATQYERAAIVWAFTHEHRTGQKSCPLCSDVNLSVTDFAHLLVRGLRTREAVMHYRIAWQAAIDEGYANEVRPGQKATLPDLTFPTFYPSNMDPSDHQELADQAETDGVGVGKVLNVRANPKAVATAFKADPEFARKVISDPEVAAAIVRDPESEIAVIRAQNTRANERRQSGGGNGRRIEPMEPFARALVTLNLLALRQDAEAMAKVAMRDFSGNYVWRGREKEKVLAELDAVTEIISNVRTVLTSEVSDDALAEFLS